MIPPFLRERNIDWLVFGLMNSDGDRRVTTSGVTIYDVCGVEVRIRLSTPYEIPIYGQRWLLLTKLGNNVCPVMSFRGNAEAAHDDLAVLRMVLPGMAEQSVAEPS